MYLFCPVPCDKESHFVFVFVVYKSDAAVDDDDDDVV